MTAATCATHPEAAAPFRCDGCARQLCDECVEHGHRLLFCRLCGERALPLEADRPATVPALRSARRRAAATRYTLADALAYPLRGTGGYAFWSVVVLTWIFDLAGAVPLLGIVAGAVGGFFGMIVALLLPRFLFAIAATTAAGEDELPDWPDFDFWELLVGAVHFLAVALFCLLPTWGFLRLAGCGFVEVMTGETSMLACLGALALGFVAAVALWVPAFGADAVYQTPWLFFRLDLHARAVAAAPGEWARTVALVGALLVAGTILPAVLSFLPLVGSLVASPVQLYALFLGAHLAGVWFRRHPEAMERVYLG